MRVLSFVLSAVLLVLGVEAAQSSQERFVQFRQQSQSGPVKLTEAAYRTLISKPRDYSTAVLLTALDNRFNCQLCRDFQPEWNLLGKSWTRGDKKGDSRLLFGYLDFLDGREIFVEMQLQTAPVLLLFPPTSGPHAVASAEPQRFDFTGGPVTAEAIHAWISRLLPDRPHPAVQRPFNWLRFGATVVIGLGAITTLAVSWRYLMPVLQSRAVWASISMILILMFTSGHMFNQIRGVPYVAGDGKGGIQYITPGFQNQLGLETQIVACIYGAMAFCIISLAVKAPRNPNHKMQTFAVYLWSLVLFIIASFLLSVFRIKNGGYPFFLPPFF